MSFSLRLLLVLLLFIRRGIDLTLSFRKFVYQKDVSEYCRRRVIPSVFLGRQVVDAYSQILHFSRLELPYSCFVSVRTESGSNIILVVQLSSEKSVIDSCRESKNQLLVYGIGETFGGYWGALPDNVMKQEPSTDENRYTLKTTQSTTTTVTRKRTTRRRTTQSTAKNLDDTYRKFTDPMDGIIVEVPLVNVSAALVPGDQPNFAIFDTEESFDSAIDVRPVPGVNYKTTVLPLVQFAISDEKSGRRTSDDGNEAGALRYKAEFNEDWFTPDARLSYPMLRLSTKIKHRRKYKYNMNTRLDFKKNKKWPSEREALFYRRSQASHKQPLVESQTGHFIERTDMQRLSQRVFNPSSNPYEIVDAILKNLSKTKDFEPKTILNIDKDVANLLQGLSKIGHNESVLLVPKESWYTRRPVSTTQLRPTKYRTDLITWRQPSASYSTNYMNEEDDTSNEDESNNKSSNTKQAMNNNGTVMLDGGKSGPLLPLYLDIDQIILNVTQQTYTTEKSKRIGPGILASQVSDTTRAATMAETKNYIEDVVNTPNVEALPESIIDSSNTMKDMNNKDSVIINVERSGPLLPLDFDVNRIILNVTQQNNNMKESIIIGPEKLAFEVSGSTTTATTPKTMKPMTLVDHESWENMVQAASLMAVVLNQSVTSSVDGERHEPNETLLPPNNARGRKKRFIHAIPIDFAKPRHLPVSVDIPSSTVHSDKIADAQEFQRLIELQDDEVHDRVALRYLRQYVGPALFNICAFDTVEPAAKYTILFNSSRLVLAITNFTLDGMSVVMTPARTLLRPDSRCAAHHLECQVLGARVCIDSLNACDGVANCGSYDVYDEDRLMCGASAGLKHNVCLAAITFLAVLLTLLYTIHYWLKRCVPKVSDAFFIYTDAAENVLYLDPIMRSPHDTDDPKDIFHNTAMHEYMECTDIPIQKNTGFFFVRWIRFFRCKRKRKLSRISSDQIIEGGYGHIDPGNRRLFSFAAIELGKMGTSYTTDAAVQTGSSLEMKLKDKIFVKERTTQVDSDSEDIVAHYEGRRRSTDNRSAIDVEMIRKDPSDELSILHFFKRARSISMQVSPYDVERQVDIEPKQSLITEEKEVQCLEYVESLTSPDPISVIAAIVERSDKKPETGPVQRRIRFEEEMTTKQATDDDEEEEGGTDPRLRRRVVYGSNKNVHLEDTDSHIIDEPSTSTGNREFKSYFWGGSKNKSKKLTPKKKKQQLILR